MRRTLLALALSIMTLGCGGDQPPECTEAVGNFYRVGCTFLDANTGDPVAMGDFLLACREVRGVANGTRCEDEMDDLLFCLDGVREQTQCADCSADLDRLLVCSP